MHKKWIYAVQSLGINDKVWETLSLHETEAGAAKARDFHLENMDEEESYKVRIRQTSLEE